MGTSAQVVPAPAAAVVEVRNPNTAVSKPAIPGSYQERGMKILVTGFTTRMSGDGSKNFYLSTSFLLAEILTKHLGHEVEHRKVVPGEDLEKYDLVLLGICPVGSFAARADYVAGSAWAFENARCR